MIHLTLITGVYLKQIIHHSIISEKQSVFVKKEQASEMKFKNIRLR